MNENDRPDGSVGSMEPVDRQFRLADWLIDPAACWIERGGEGVHLEPKVMQVLTHLAARPGTVVSRQELEDSVWAGTVVGYDAVTNAIIKLRKALSDDARHPQIIETISKRGYRLIGEVAPLSVEAAIPAPSHPPRGREGAAGADSSPPGEAGSSTSTVDATRRKLGRHALAIALVVLMVVMAGVVAWWRPWAPDVEPASLARMAYPLPDKPSIAVLPFDNLSGDPGQDFLADGFTENIINSLARVPSVLVIARNSTGVYKGEAVKVQQVAEELSVRYVLEGSVQRSGDRLRVSAQLIDALNGHHLWADRYDRAFENLFALQDEITRKVLIELQVKLTTGEGARLASRGTSSLEAWLLRIQAFAELNKWTRERVLKARELYRAATAVDPEYGRGWAGIAYTYLYEGRMGGWDVTRTEAFSEAVRFAERAIEVDPDDNGGYGILGAVALYSGDNERGLELARQTVSLAPNDFQAVGALGFHLVWAGEPQLALETFARARRLSPRNPNWLPLMEGLAQHMLGLHEDAIVSLKDGIKRVPGAPFGYVRLISVYADLGRLEEARVITADLLELNPAFTISGYLATQPFKNPERKDWIRELLVKAGLPE